MLALVILAARYLPGTRFSSGGERRFIPQKAGAWTLPYAGILSACAAFYAHLSVLLR
jgi:hypothetical protein